MLPVKHYFFYTESFILGGCLTPRTYLGDGVVAFPLQEKGMGV